MNNIDLNNYQNSVEKKATVFKWIIILMGMSSAMVFFGLMSAYIVSKGDQFWVQTSAPSSFMTSTVIILISSLTIHLSYKSYQKGALKQGLVFLSITFALAIAFVVSQFMAYSQLIEKGSHLTGNNIVNPYSKLQLTGPVYNMTEVDDTLNLEIDYLYEQLYSLNEFGIRDIAVTDTMIFSTHKRVISFDFKNGAITPFSLIFDDGIFYNMNDKERAYPLNERKLSYAGFITPLGKYGEDYTIVLKERALLYKDANFYSPDDLEMMRPINEKLVKYTDNASSYLYLITALHLIHIFVSLVVLIVAFVKALGNRYNAEYYVGIKSVSLGWHYLDAMWIFIYIFLFLMN